MKTAVLLFTYNRSYHTKKVIDALSKNTILPQKLFVFQDGLKKGADEEEWKRVNHLIHEIDWCDNEIVVAEHNKGLAASIVSGINYAFREYESVIVLEDDCVPANSFVSFMQQCFEKYAADKRVYCVSGYSWPIKQPKNRYDVYGCGRVSSWGWGTWKDRWEQYSVSYGILKHFKKDKKKSRYLAAWGSDCEQMLLDNVVGKNDSWAIHWGLLVLENSGICINPYMSLIQNIGMDGSGVHCSVSNRFQVDFFEEEKTKFFLPDHIDILETTETAFADLYGSYAIVHKKNKLSEEVLIYGLGNFYFQHEKEIHERYYVKAFIDRSKKGEWYAGKEVIYFEEIGGYDCDKIVIMLQDIQECIYVARGLLDYGVSSEKIILGHSLFGICGKELSDITVTTDGCLQIWFRNIFIKIRSKKEFEHVYQVFVESMYRSFINNEKRNIVIDVGMGIGDTTLFFAVQDHVEKVYGFNFFEEDFLIAEQNLGEVINAGKAEVLQHGNGDNILGLFPSIIMRHSDCNLILRVGNTRAEYRILESLLESGLLMHFKTIMLELHKNDSAVGVDCLKTAGFSWWQINNKKDMRLIYAYK